MKHFVRILIAVLIVGITGFGVWFLAFRDKPNEAVFKKMTATLDHLGEVTVAYEYTDGSKTVASEVTGYSNIINKYLNVSLEKNKYLADAKEDGPEDDVYAFYSNEIENIRKNISELNKYDNYSMKAINYYYSLSVNAEKVKNRDKKKLVEAADNYVNAVNNVVDIVDDSISYRYG